MMCQKYKNATDSRVSAPWKQLYSGVVFVEKTLWTKNRDVQWLKKSSILKRQDAKPRPPVQHWLTGLIKQRLYICYHMSPCWSWAWARITDHSPRSSARTWSIIRWFPPSHYDLHRMFHVHAKWCMGSPEGSSRHHSFFMTKATLAACLHDEVTWRLLPGAAQATGPLCSASCAVMVPIFTRLENMCSQHLFTCFFHVPVLSKFTHF